MVQSRSPRRRLRRMAASGGLVSMVLLATTLTIVTTTGSGSDMSGRVDDALTTASAQSRAGRPNIVLLSSDDQADFELRWMPRTRKILKDQGVTFSDGMNPHPLCCPARAEILTGEYAQNNGVHHNMGPWGGYEAFVSQGNRDQNLAVWLHDAGYLTGFVGKPLNGYKAQSPRMGGWDYWSPTSKGDYAYYGTQFLNNGTPRTYRNKYVADVVRDQARKLITRWQDEDRPFFIWASHVGPHVTLDGRGARPPTPARRHQNMFRDLKLPTKKKASFNEAGVSDKPAVVRHKKQKAARVTHLFRQRVRTLQAIDEANAAVINTLRKTGQLKNTVVAYISDNGFQLGEHRLVGKNFPYKENLQVPFVMRGPGIPAGRTVDATATIVDLAPTFLQYAKHLGAVRRAGHTDGLALQPFLRGRQMPNTTTLIQAGDPARPWRWRGVRTDRYTYAVWHDGVKELYDRVRDPFENHNLLDPETGRLTKPAYRNVLAELRSRRSALLGCAGPSACERQDFGPEPKPRRRPN